MRPWWRSSLPSSQPLMVTSWLASAPVCSLRPAAWTLTRSHASCWVKMGQMTVKGMGRLAERRRNESPSRELPFPLWPWGVGCAVFRVSLDPPPAAWSHDPLLWSSAPPEGWDDIVRNIIYCTFPLKSKKWIHKHLCIKLTSQFGCSSVWEPLWTAFVREEITSLSRSIPNIRLYEQEGCKYCDYIKEQPCKYI